MAQQITEPIAAREPRAAYHDLAAIEDPDLVRPQRDTHVRTDEAGWDGVLILPDRDPGGRVDLRRQRQPVVEVLERQRGQQRSLIVEVEAHRGSTVVDVPDVLGDLGLLDLLVQLRRRVGLKDRDKMRATEPAALVFDAALFVSALDAGAASPASRRRQHDQ
nr:hypothetical protein [Streptomyces glaucescens]